MSPAEALDVGAGSGRDALWLSQLGWRVTSAEPATGLRTLGKKATQGEQVRWASAALPRLAGLEPPQNGYRLILLSAVWMHLPERERSISMQRLGELLADDGVIVITLRFGPMDAERPMYPVSVEELIALSESNALQAREVANENEDKLGRQNVRWKIVIISKGVRD